MNFSTLSRRSLIFISVAFASVFGAMTLISAAPGDRDSTFGAGGIAITNIRRSDRPSAMLVQPDGKIVVVGGSEVGVTFDHDFALTRYNADGSPDNSFGTSGTVLTPLSGLDDVALTAAIQPDGSIIAAGYSEDSDNLYNVALVRYHPDGSLDSSFGMGGIVKTTLGSTSSASGVLVQPDGKIVVAGTVAFSFLVVRYNPDGSIDNSFGTDGRTISPIPGVISSFVSGAALQSDGKIVLVGASRIFVSPFVYEFTLARYLPDGTLDTSFSNDGVVVSQIGRCQAYAVAIQADGKIVAAGIASTAALNSGEFALARYNPNGTLDQSFGTAGVVKAALSNSDDRANAVAIQPNGKIVAAGSSMDTSTGTNSFGLLRLNSNGSPDATFGTNGIVFTDINTLHDTAEAVAIQPDGKILAAGFNGDFTSNNEFVVVRYLGDAPARRVRFDFDGDGRSDVSFFRPSNGVWYLNLSQAGFGYTRFGYGTDVITPADYDGDGKTDIAVFRNGIWFWLNSSNNTFQGTQFGEFGDVPIPADFTGDGRAELAVYRDGIWYWLNLTNNQVQGAQFGIVDDEPVPADYDGDGKVDLAVVRLAGGTSTWYILGTTQGFYGLQFGLATDKLVPADYDGDGKVDVAVFRDGAWYVQASTQGFYGVQFGIASDIPVAADYDGDGKADVAVFRDGTWYLLRSQQGFSGVQFGAINDRPIPSAFMP